MPPASSQIHLPNGYTFTVTPVFGGISFRSEDLNPSHNVFPPGWTIMLRTEKNPSHDAQTAHQSANLFPHHREASPEPTHHSSRSPQHGSGGEDETRDVPSHRFKWPTLNNDVFFISSIYFPSSSDFKPAGSPTRQIAMLLWATLWWYFHQPEPSPYLATDESALTPEAGKPRGEWRIYVKQEGVLKGRNLMCKLERMGLLATEESFVGEDNADVRQPGGWQEMFVSRRSFWQLDPCIFLFTLAPTTNTPTFSPFPGNSPHHSRSVSPSRDFGGGNLLSPGTAEGPPPVLRGPFTSSSHLPTYFPPPPVQYTFTNGVRHPIRQKPPRQGEVFYVRHVPSVDEHLSFRVPVLPSHLPTDPLPDLRESIRTFHRKSRSMSSLSDSSLHGRMDAFSTDLEILHRWMNNPRVNAAWGVAGPQATQEKFLRDGLKSRHSFPVFGCWNGKPFGYFEIYWVKEDRLGQLLGGQVDNFDRGIHCLVGEEDFRGSHRVAIWLSALVHYCWLADNRTETVMLEPRVDNKKFISYLQKAGFYKEGEVTFPHKQSAVMKIKRDSWESPAL